MRTASLFVAAALALAQLAVATPPACLLGALQKQPNPADLTALCGTLQDAVEGNLTEVCSGAALSGAYSAYSSTCLASASVTVAALPNTSSSSSSSAASTTGSGSGSAKTTAPGSTAASPTGATTTGSGSGSAAPSETGKSAAGAPAAPMQGLGLGLLALSGLLGSGFVGVLLL